MEPRKFTIPLAHCMQRQVGRSAKIQMISQNRTLSLSDFTSCTSVASKNCLPNAMPLHMHTLDKIWCHVFKMRVSQGLILGRKYILSNMKRNLVTIQLNNSFIFDLISNSKQEVFQKKNQEGPRIFRTCITFDANFSNT